MAVVPHETPELARRDDVLVAPEGQDEAARRHLGDAVRALHEGLGEVVLDELAPFEEQDDVQGRPTTERVVVQHPAHVARRRPVQLDKHLSSQPLYCLPHFILQVGEIRLGCLRSFLPFSIVLAIIGTIGLLWLDTVCGEQGGRQHDPVS